MGEGEELVYTVTGDKPYECRYSRNGVSEPPAVSPGHRHRCANVPIELADLNRRWRVGRIRPTPRRPGLVRPAATGVGTHVLVYTVGTASCAVSDSADVEVAALPALSALNDALVCIGDSAFGEVAIEGATNLASYTFVWEAPAVAGSDSPWEASTGPFLVPGAVMASVTVTDSLGCESSATLQWEVQALPEISLQSEWAVCANEGTVELPAATPDNGIWAGTGVESGLFNASTAAGKTR